MTIKCVDKGRSTAFPRLIEQQLRSTLPSFYPAESVRSDRFHRVSKEKWPSLSRLERVEGLFKFKLRLVLYLTSYVSDQR